MTFDNIEYYSEFSGVPESNPEKNKSIFTKNVCSDLGSDTLSTLLKVEWCYSQKLSLFLTEKQCFQIIVIQKRTLFGWQCDNVMSDLGFQWVFLAGRVKGC